MTTKFIKERQQVRRLFTRNVTKLEDDVEKGTAADFSIETDYLKQKIEKLRQLNQAVQDVMLETEKEDVLDMEFDECEEYEQMWLRIKQMTGKRRTNTTKNNLNLPKIEIRKFNDDPKTWIPFWGQYKKIHEDGSLDDEDKFQYLIQAMAEGSKARNLVESYPPTKDNYEKVIDTLKTRFAKDEVLIDIYVRELLSLVVSKNSLTVDTLYDKIVVNLQTLESLGIVKEKYECLLLPMIESSLPDGTLISWSKVSIKRDESKLSQLMMFLKGEVEAEGRCKLARTSFQAEAYSSIAPTASCLVTKEVKKDSEKLQKTGMDSCYFCDKMHSTYECSKAGNLILEEKKNLIKKRGGCYVCLKRGHLAKFCKVFVKCISCAKRHLYILCPSIQIKGSIDKNEFNRECKSDRCVSINNFSSSNKAVTLLQTLVVNVKGNKKEKKLRVLLDSGSQRSYIKTGVALDLGLEIIGSEHLGDCLFGGVQRQMQTHSVVKVIISDVSSSYTCTLLCLEQEKLCGYLPKVRDLSLLQRLLNCGISLTDTNEDINDISILIGSDWLGSILENEMIRVTDNLVANKTKLGWTIQGPMQNAYSCIVNSHLVNSLQNDDSLEFMWNIETLSIKDPYAQCDLEIAEVLKIFNDNLCVNSEGRYETNLIWKLGRPKLESNYDQAFNRLLSTTKKLEKIGYMSFYNDVFVEWLKEGVIEEAKDVDITQGHYLPHHAVIKLDRATTKIRPVFDASAKDKNSNSLNNCMEKGPNLIELIPKLLINFRAGRYAVTADIRKAFLQISISPADRQNLKMLWWKDIETKNELITYQHNRVPFGVACSPFILAATVKHHLEKHKNTYLTTAGRLERSFYVDNCVTSFDSEKDLNIFKMEAIELMNKGKFDLRCWMMNKIEHEEDETDTVSVLGIKWNRRTDILGCNFIKKNLPQNSTKRILLSIVQQIFDPLGFWCPITIVPKLLMQKVWQLNIGWDDKIPKEYEAEYFSWLESLDVVQQCQVPRRLSKNPLNKSEVSIHVFCDASKNAYASCIFIRTKYEGEVSVQLLIAKSRVAPIKKQMSLPKLELMGALIGSRLYKEVLTSGLLADCKHQVYCWTDSSVVLAWLKRPAMWKVYVSNRVKEINKNVQKECWNHLPGVHNPADLPSRGCDAKSLLQLHWWTGPLWWYADEDQWPKSNKEIDDKEEEIIAHEENKRATVCLETNKETFSNVLLYFCEYKKIVRLVARLLRMSPKIRNKYNIQSLHINYEEYKNAEETLIKLIQKEVYTVEKRKAMTLNIIEEENILKVKTRLNYSGEKKSFILPILLPGDHEIVKRLFQEKHKIMSHAGVQMIMTELRDMYWITGVRRLAKKVVAQCIICKRYKAKHYDLPQPPLPSDRIGNFAAFEITGIDLAGPLILKDSSKCWIVLYTCAVYRAIHLELTDSLSTASFIMTLRRFISRRGRVRIIYTDNGTNFVGASNLLRDVNWQDVEETSVNYNITWKFSAPAAPWWGGWWERLIRLMKDLLRRVLGKSSVNWIELSTILCDCEAVINNRPLTYVEMGDLRPLTPSMFIQSLPCNDTHDLDQIDHKGLNKRHKYLQQLRDDFRIRFRNEYLALLVNKGKQNKIEPKVGDIVLIETEKSRLHWPLGLITEVYEGKDGYSRAAKLHTASGEIVRAYQRLYPLEVSAESQEWLKGVSQRSSDNVQATPQDDRLVGTARINKPSLPLPQLTRSGRNIRIPSRYLD